MTSEDIKDLRTQLGMSQQAFAASLGVSFATVNRWENGKAKPQKDRIERMRMLSQSTPGPAPALTRPNRLDFEGDAEAVKLVVETIAFRLSSAVILEKIESIRETQRLLTERLNDVTCAHVNRDAADSLTAALLYNSLVELVCWLGPGTAESLGAKCETKGEALKNADIAIQHYQVEKVDITT